MSAQPMERAKVDEDQIAMGAAREIDLADFVQDRVTGYEGTVVAKCRYMDGTTQIAVASRMHLHEGLPAEWYWFDIKRAMFRDGGIS